MAPPNFDSRKYLNSFVVFLFSLLVLYWFQKTNFSNPFLRGSDSFWLSLADKVTTGTCNFVYLIVKIILLALASSLISFSLPPAEKTQYFAHLRSNSTLQLLNRILIDLQKLLKYFNVTTTVAFLKIPFTAFGASWATVFPNNLVLYLKDLKLLVLAILLLKLFASSFE